MHIIDTKYLESIHILLKLTNQQVKIKKRTLGSSQRAILPNQRNRAREKSKVKTWTYIIVILILQLSHVVCQPTYYSSYDLHGLSPGATTIVSTYNPGTTMVWQFASKQQ